MERLEIFNKIPEIAETFLYGQLNAEQKSVLYQIEQDPICRHEYHEYIRLYQNLRNFSKRKKVKNILVRYTKIHQRKLTRYIELAQSKKKWIDAVSTAAAIIGFAFATFYLIDSRLDKNNKALVNLSGEVKKLKVQQAIDKQEANKHILPIKPSDNNGTAFAISKDGLFVSAYHVVHEADSAYVILGNGDAYQVDVLAKDPTKDIAILKIKDQEFKYKENFPYQINLNEVNLASDIYTLSFSKSEKVFGKGYISSKNGYNADTVTYQLYLPASAGSSGSPVIDSKSNIIGFIDSKKANEEGITYAVKMKYVEELIKNTPEIKNNILNKLNSGSQNLDLKQQIQNLNNFIVNLQVYK